MRELPWAPVSTLHLTVTMIHTWPNGKVIVWPDYLQRYGAPISEEQEANTDAKSQWIGREMYSLPGIPEAQIYRLLHLPMIPSMGIPETTTEKMLLLLR